MHALVLVDLQNDFTPAIEGVKPKGALAVPGANDVPAVVNRVMHHGEGTYDLIVATQDWHPPGHLSFASQHPGHQVFQTIEWDGLEQILWPDHCVQHTDGAAFLDTLDIDKVEHIFQKGTDRRIDSYSGFYDNGHRKATGLGDYLHQREITHVTVAGLATDFCVKFTALDAARLGFQTTVIEDACRGVDLNPGDIDDAWSQMAQAGIQRIRSID